MSTIQTGIESKKSKKIDAISAMWIFNPIGSTYKDPQTKETITRTEPTFQYAKSGVPNKWQFSKTDFENIDKLMASKEYEEILAILPDSITLEPNST